MVDTFKSQQAQKSTAPTLDKVQKKFALPLWVKLQHSQPEQSFSVLITLAKNPSLKDIEQLEKMGLEIAAFHREHPNRLMPGVITKARLEEQLVHWNLVEYIEGVPYQP